MVKRGYIQSVWHRAWHLAAFNTFAAISINLSLNCIPVPWCCVPGRGEKGEYIYWGWSTRGHCQQRPPRMIRRMAVSTRAVR